MPTQVLASGLHRNQFVVVAALAASVMLGCSSKNEEAVKECAYDEPSSCPAGFTCMFMGAKTSAACRPTLCATFSECCGNLLLSEEAACLELARTGDAASCANALKERTDAGLCVRDPAHDRICNAEGTACPYPGPTVDGNVESTCCTGAICVAEAAPASNKDDGHCVACGGEAAACEPGQSRCCQGFACNVLDHQCHRLNAVGEGCIDWSDCEAGLLCAAGKCAKQDSSGGGGGSDGGSGKGTCDPTTCNDTQTECSDGFCFSCVYFCEDGTCKQACN